MAACQLIGNSGSAIRAVDSGFLVRPCMGWPSSYLVTPEKTPYTHQKPSSCYAILRGILRMSPRRRLLPCTAVVFLLALAGPAFAQAKPLEFHVTFDRSVS